MTVDLNLAARNVENIRDLLAENAKLRAMLKQLEWTTLWNLGYYSGCAICKNTLSGGHKSNCELVALLREEQL
jgi:hypothetical protein